MASLLDDIEKSELISESHLNDLKFLCIQNTVSRKVYTCIVWNWNSQPIVTVVAIHKTTKPRIEIHTSDCSYGSHQIQTTRDLYIHLEAIKNLHYESTR